MNNTIIPNTNNIDRNLNQDPFNKTTHIRSNSNSKKGFYIPNANISVVEKNPMNITIYNIRNSSRRREDSKLKGSNNSRKVNHPLSMDFANKVVQRF